MDRWFDSVCNRLGYYNPPSRPLSMERCVLMGFAALLGLVVAYALSQPSPGQLRWQEHQEAGLGRLVRTYPTVVFAYSEEGKQKILDLDGLSDCWRERKEQLGVCTNMPLWHYDNVPGLYGKGIAVMCEKGAIVAPAPELKYDPIYLDDSTFIEKVNEH